MKWVLPAYSKSQIDSAGRTLAALLTSEEELDAAFTVLDNWRAAHSFPLNTIQMGLRTKARSVDARALVAQRLKRVPSILFKLDRFPNMRLSQMQDIGGCRAVVSSVVRVFDLRDLYTASRSMHSLRTEKDYISDPQVTGYRGIHLIYSFRSPQSPAFSGLPIEIQLRSRSQHAWATAVETVGILLKQSLKSNLGEAQWLRFFAEASAVFAEAERTAPVPGVVLTGEPLKQSVLHQLHQDRLGKRLRDFGRALTVARARADSSAFYFLLALNPSGGELRVTGYRRSELAHAPSMQQVVAARAQSQFQQRQRASAASFESRDEAGQAAACGAHTEMARCGVLDVVRLVEDNAPIRWQHGAAAVVVLRATNGQIAEQQMMVHDEDVRGDGFTSRLLVEALLEMRTLRAQAYVGFACDLFPDLGRRIERQILERPLRRRFDPFDDRVQIATLSVIEQRITGLAREQCAPDRNVVAASLDQRETERPRERRAQERQVLPDELLLKVDRVRRDDGAFAVACGPLDRGHEIRH